jgi:hypothetical protein
MNFQSVQTALVTILGAAEASRYRTVGYKDEPIGQSEILNTNKLVSVHYKEGSFPDHVSGRQGPVTHKCTFNIELKLSQKAVVDIATLENVGATEGQRATALAGLQDAKDLANTNLDAFISIILGVLMDSRNAYLGLSKSIFGNRWISKIKKEDPMYFGDSVICSAILIYECDIEETFVGDTGDAGDIIDLTVKVNDEPTDGQTGVKKE